MKTSHQTEKKSPRVFHAGMGFLAVTALSACGGGGGGGDNTSANKVTNDLYAFASSTSVTVPTPKGVLANDGADLVSVELLSNVNAASSLTLASDGSFTYRPGAGLDRDSFRYRAMSDDGKTQDGQVTIVLDLDGAGCTEMNTANAQSVAVRFSPTDLTSAAGLTYSIISQPSKGSLVGLDSALGSATYQFAGNSRGADTFEVRVQDDFGGVSSFSYTLALSPVRIMPLGDSLTQGITSDSVQEPSDASFDSPPMDQRVGYRKPLFDLLNNAGYRFDFVGSQTDAGFNVFNDYQHQGHPGFSDYEIAGSSDPDGSNSGDTFTPGVDGIYNWLSDNPADVILLHAGTNNIRFRTSSVGVENILNEIDRWESDNSAMVSTFVAKIVDKNRNTDDHANVLAFNADLEPMVNARIAGDDELVLVDMYSAVPYSIAPASNPTFDASDKTHLTNTGYQRMADGWKSAIDANPALLGKCN